MCRHVVVLAFGVQRVLVRGETWGESREAEVDPRGQVFVPADREAGDGKVGSGDTELEVYSY